MSELLIRKYQDFDRQRLLAIGADTAFFGDPIEAYFDDRILFQDAFYSYYTDVEPTFTWVACYGSEVVGFLAGCLDTKNYQRDIRRIIIPRVFKRLIRWKYIIGARSISYMNGLLGGFFFGDFSPVDYSTYPAHLHINIDKGWRGFGLGRKLILAYIDQLSSINIKGVHLQTTSQNQIACRLYENLDFRILWARTDHFWTKWFGYKVENRCYGRLLS